MRELRRRMETTFASLGCRLVRRAWWVIAASLFVVTALGIEAGKLVVDTSPEGMLHPSDPVRVAYDAFREEFGRDALVVVGVETSGAFDERFVARLEALHRDLEERVPYLREVTSLVDARWTRGDEEEFVVGELLEDWRARGWSAAALGRFAAGHPLYRDNYVAASGSFAALFIETEAVLHETVTEDDALAAFDDSANTALETDSSAAPVAPRFLGAAENADVVDAVKAVLAKHRTQGFDPVLSGTPVIVAAFDRATMADIRVCGSASALAILVVLALFFRRVSGVILPNLVVAAALVSTFGMKAAFGSAFTLASNGLLPIVIAVGVCSSVHILTIFYRNFAACGDKTQAIAESLGHAGPAVVMTSLTTAAGLLSFAMADLASTAHVGRFASAGVVACLVFSVALLPALLAVSPIRRHVASPSESPSADRVLAGIADFSTRCYRPILFGSLVLFGLAAVGATSLRFAHDPISYFAPETRERSDLAVIDRELRGGTTLEVVVDSGRENGLHDPALLQAIDDAARELPERTRGVLEVTRVFSLNDIVKESHQALHANDPDAYRIPDSQKTLTQELFLFENSGSDDLGRLVDPQYRRTRITIKTPHADGVVYRDFVDEVETLFRERLYGMADVTITGGMALDAQVIPKALKSMTEGYVSAFVVISLLMVVFLGSFRMGAVSMVPNLLPILCVMGIMGFLDVPIDQTTITIGSIGLGLVVDDTIHFLYNFQKYHEKTGDVRRAVEESFLGAGRAMAVTSAVLLACFWVDLLASLSNVVRFGVLVGAIVILALLADFLVAPALMRWMLEPRRSFVPRLARAASVLLASVRVAPVARRADLVPGEPIAIDPADPARAIMQRVQARDDGEFMNMELEMKHVDRRRPVSEQRARFPWELDF